MTLEPTFDQDAFFVEGSVPSTSTQETPESIDTGDYVFSNNSNFLPIGPLYVSNQYTECLDASHESTITNITSSKGAVA